MKKLIGNMDRKVVVQQRAVTKDGYGGQSESWADLYNVWAQYTPQAMTGMALTEMADQPQLMEKATFTIRWKSIPSDARIVYNGHIWKIIGMAEVGRKDRLQINAVKTDSVLFGDEAVNATIGTTGQTLQQLSDFYEDAISAGVPEIYYQRPQHKHEWETVLGPANYPLGYQAKHAAGDLNPLQPAAISHVAEIDYTADLRGKTLTHNNEFGNKHRFTYDDGVEATELKSNNRIYVQGGHSEVGPGGDGYTGTNPQYIIDHLTGLGWHRTYNSSSTAATNNEWWEGANPRYNLAGATSFHSYYEAADALTLDGHSDWRVATLQELLMGYGGPTDGANAMLSDANTDMDMYFPPVNTVLRDSGTRIITLGPIDYNTKPEDETPLYIGWPNFQTNGAVVTLYNDAQMQDFFTGTRNDLGMFALVRKHY